MNKKYKNMIIRKIIPDVNEVVRLREVVSGQISHIFNGKETVRPKELLRIEVAIESLDLLSWLNQNENLSKIYWCDRKQNLEIAGIGQAHLIHGKKLDNYYNLFNKLSEYLSPKYSDLRYYGGISFNPQKEINEDWHSFGAYYFLLPRFELVCSGDKTKFIVNYIFNEQKKDVQLNALLEQLQLLTFNVGGFGFDEPYLIKRIDTPEKKEWLRIVSAALNDIDQGIFQKIVLARRAKFEFIKDLNPFDILSKLKIVNPESMHFCFQPHNDYSFIGSTPELLYYKDGKYLYSEAIAGTRTRGVNEKEDERLEHELLSNQKEIREHRFVLDSVKEVLSNFCEQLRVNDRLSVLKLARIQHLYAFYEGVLSEDVCNADLISKLHPTPAVGGYPSEPALERIEELEPFQRGWYAAPIGWLSHDAAKFAVAIRSGLIKRNNLYLFSGSGIVTGSQPESEWEEIENKIANFLKVLHINGDAQTHRIPEAIPNKYLMS